MSRRVLLVNPRMTSRDSVRLPLSVLALGAALEGRHDYSIVDGNLDAAAADTVLARLAAEPHDLVGLTVMPGPQVVTAIEISRAVRAAHPRLPIVWGGYFPTLYPDAALNADYVDLVVRGQGEGALLELLQRLPAPPAEAAADLAGVSWRNGAGPVHNAQRPPAPPAALPPLPYERVGDVGAYLRPSFMGRRTAVHQSAVGCRYNCTFCGVVSMFDGATELETPERLAAALARLRELGADAVQFYDHNFFDREETSVPILEVLARERLPWWCYARADTLAGFSTRTWELIRRSRLRMAYIGAEAASDEVLRGMRKGTRVLHTLEAARRCREYGVIPELSFVIGGPDDPEGEVERTFELVKEVKRIHPESEIVLYFYSPTPQRNGGGSGRLPILERYGPDGPPLPDTPEGWVERRWIDYVCHRDAPWLSARVKRRVRDFARVLGCRYPTVQDVTTPAWGRTLLKTLAGWRWSTGVYARPVELDLARRLVRLRDPKSQSL